MSKFKPETVRKRPQIQKNGGMYIFPECIGNVNWKLLNKDDRRSSNPLPADNFKKKPTPNNMMRSFSRINKSTSCLTSIFQKTFNRFVENFEPQCITGKIYSRHLFRNRGFINCRSSGRNQIYAFVTLVQSSTSVAQCLDQFTDNAFSYSRLIKTHLPFRINKWVCI